MVILIELFDFRNGQASDKHQRYSDRDTEGRLE